MNKFQQDIFSLVLKTNIFRVKVTERNRIPGRRNNLLVCTFELHMVELRGSADLYEPMNSVFCPSRAVTSKVRQFGNSVF